MKVLDAQIFVDDDNRVKISKNCDSHGDYIDTYTFSDPELYDWAEKYAELGAPIDNPRTDVKDGCPYDCGI